MKNHLLVSASLLLVAACVPGSPATPKAKASDAPKLADKTPATAPPGILGKMKEPVGLARQTAMVTSLHDLLPVSLASKGMNSLHAASSLLSDNGGGLIGNNGGSILGKMKFGLLQAGPSLLPDYVKFRQDAVLHQQPDGLLSAVISLYDVKKYDPKPGADNEPALIDRFHMDVADFKVLPDDLFSFDLDLKVVSSKRIPFVDKILLRETGRAAPGGGFAPTAMEYFVDFGVALLDGAKDQAALHLVAGAADLVPALDENGKPGASFEAKRMDLTGDNGHGSYKGEANFRAGGDIDCTCNHTRADGAETKGVLALHPDGSNVVSATSGNGKASLQASTATDGTITFEVRDLALPDTPLIPVEVKLADGVVTFDLGAGPLARARIFAAGTP